MKRIFRRAILAASGLGVAVGIVLTALPASAATAIYVKSGSQTLSLGVSRC